MLNIAVWKGDAPPLFESPQDPARPRGGGRQGPRPPGRHRANDPGADLSRQSRAPDAHQVISRGGSGLGHVSELGSRPSALTASLGLSLLVSGDLGEDGRRSRYSMFSSAPTRSLQGARHPPESVIGMAESPIGLHRNG